MFFSSTFWPYFNFRLFTFALISIFGFLGTLKFSGLAVVFTKFGSLALFNNFGVYFYSAQAITEARVLMSNQGRLYLVKAYLSCFDILKYHAMLMNHHDKWSRDEFTFFGYSAAVEHRGHGHRLNVLYNNS